MTDAANVLSILDYVTAAGEPVSGGSIEFYQAGTSTARTVYSDAALTVSLGTIVYTDSEGFPVSTQGGSTRVSIYTGTGAYKVIVKNSSGTTLFTRDNIPGALDTSGFGTTSALPTVPVSAKTAAYTITTSDRGYLFNCNPTGGTFVMTLPSAVTAGDNFTVGIRHNGTANQVTLAAVSSQNIRGPGTPTSYFSLVGRGEEVWLASDGADWIVTSYVPALIRPGVIPPVLHITDRLTAAPSSPTAGARYIVNGSPTGTWSTLGFAQHDIAEADGNGSWIKYTPANGWLAYVSDETLYTAFYASAWNDQSGMAAAQSSVLGYAVFADQKADGTVGGTATTGAWTKRTINTTLANTITGCSLASSVVTLTTGSYLVWASSYQQRTNGAGISILQGASTRWYGLPGNTAADGAHLSVFAPIVVSGASDTIELDYYAQSNSTTSDLGAALSLSGNTETYAIITILSLSSLQGATGAQGALGTDGLDAAYPYQWSTSTSGDPGSGKIAGNNATIASITQLAISETDSAGGSMAAVIATWDDSTSSVRATVKISKEGATQNFHAFRITGAGTDQGSYWTFPVTYIATSGTIAHADNCAVLCIEKGDKGDIGLSGVTVPDTLGLTEDTSPDRVNDWLMTYDVSASGNKKIHPLSLWSNIQPVNVMDHIPTSEHAAIRDRTTTTNLTAYVAAAIAAVPSAGGVLDFPEGKFICDIIRTPALGKPTWFRGAGRGRTLIQALNANTPIFAGVTAPDVSSPYLSPHRHSGFTCVAHASGSTGAAIDMQKWSFSEVSDIGFAANGAGQWTYGFLLDATEHCYSNRIDDVEIIAANPISTALFRGTTSANWHVLSRVTVVGSTMAAVVSLAAGTPLYNWTYRDWHIEGISGISTVAFLLGNGHFRQDFINCWLEDVGDCFATAATTTGSVQNVTFSGGNVQGIPMPVAFARLNCTIPTDAADVSDYMPDTLSLGGSVQLAAGYGINFGYSDVTLSHSTNALTFSSATNGYTFQDGPVYAPNYNVANGGRVGTTFSVNDDYSLSGWDVDGAAWVDFITINAANVPTCDLADAVTKSGQYIYRGGGTDVPVTDGGTGLSAGTSGGVPYFSSSTTMASSGALTSNALVKGGGAGAAPAASGVICDASNNLSGIGAIANTGSITMTNGSLRVSDGYAGVSWDDNYVTGTNVSDQIGIVCGGTERMTLRLGVQVGAPTGGDKGAGTLNAVGVYDDNTLLTDYVFDKFLGRSGDYAERIKQKADKLDPSMFDAAKYAAYWREHGRLWGMPDLNDCVNGVVKNMSLGNMVQLLWQAVELQAIHIDEMRRKLEEKSE